MLIEHPNDAIAGGSHNHVPLILGAQTQDGYNPCNKPNVHCLNEFSTRIDAILAECIVDPAARAAYLQQILAVYAPFPIPDCMLSFVELQADTKHHCPNRRLAVSMSPAQSEPVYWYELSYILPFPRDEFLANHALVTPFALQGIRDRWLPAFMLALGDPANSFQNIALADCFLDAFERFTGNGGLSGLSPAWPQVASTAPTAQILDIPLASSPAHKDAKGDLWDEFVEICAGSSP